jgi:hypothetical protein
MNMNFGKTSLQFTLKSKEEDDGDFDFRAEGLLLGRNLTKEDVQLLVSAVGHVMQKVKARIDASPVRFFN